jgi:hypothetical protein
MPRASPARSGRTPLAARGRTPCGTAPATFQYQSPYPDLVTQRGALRGAPRASCWKSAPCSLPAQDMPPAVGWAIEHGLAAMQAEATPLGFMVTRVERGESLRAPVPRVKRFQMTPNLRERGPPGRPASLCQEGHPERLTFLGERLHDSVLQAPAVPSVRRRKHEDTEADPRDGVDARRGVSSVPELRRRLHGERDRRRPGLFDQDVPLILPQDAAGPRQGRQRGTEVLIDLWRVSSASVRCTRERAVLTPQRGDSLACARGTRESRGIRLQGVSGSHAGLGASQ